MDTETKDPLVAAIETFVDGKSDAGTTEARHWQGWWGQALARTAWPRLHGCGRKPFPDAQDIRKDRPAEHEGTRQGHRRGQWCGGVRGRPGCAAALDAPPRGTRFGRAAGRGVSSEPVYGSHT